MSKYQLSIVTDGGDEITEIGKFNDEKELAKWANENDGELEGLCLMGWLSGGKGK